MTPAARLCAVLASLLLTLPARASEEPGSPEGLSEASPGRRLTVSHLVVGMVNPVGAEYQARAGYQQRLWEGTDALLLRDTHVFLGGQLRVNPCYTGVGPELEWLPLAVLKLRARAEVLGFYGTLGMVQSFGSPGDDWRDSLVQQRTEAGDFYSTWGWHAALEPTLQAQVGPLALASTLSMSYWGMRLHGGDTVWYDAGLDTLVPGKGWTVSNETHLLHLAGPWVAGLNLRYTAPLYGSRELPQGAPPGGVDNSHLRLGLLAAHTFSAGAYSQFHRPTLFAIVGWYLHHRYRTGVAVSQAIPSVLLGFTFQQDFLR